VRSARASSTSCTGTFSGPCPRRHADRDARMQLEQRPHPADGRERRTRARNSPEQLADGRRHSCCWPGATAAAWTALAAIAREPGARQCPRRPRYPPAKALLPLAGAAREFAGQRADQQRRRRRLRACSSSRTGRPSRGLLATNLEAPMRSDAGACCQWLKAQPQAAIVNIGSTFGSLPFAGFRRLLGGQGRAARVLAGTCAGNWPTPSVAVIHLAPRAIDTLAQQRGGQGAEPRAAESTATAPKTVARQVVAVPCRRGRWRAPLSAFRNGCSPGSTASPRR
jgi:hypothetical protein